MTLGADRNKVIILSVLGLIGAYTFYTNVLSSDSGTPAPQGSSRPAGRAVLPDVPGVASTPLAASSARRQGSRSRTTDEFRPSMKRRPEDKLDPTTIDPTLRLDLLAKVQSVNLEGGGRNLFQFSTPPPPPLPKDEPKLMPKRMIGPQPPPPKENAAAKPAAAPKPPPVPINLKYYGYSTARLNGHKTAFFLDGDDILVAAEGETLKKRYKVVRIGVNSVVMEDVDSKHQQTLPLTEEAQG